MLKNFNPKDLRANPLQGGGVDTEQVSSWGLISLVRVLNQVGQTWTLGQELGCPRSILTWDLEKFQLRLGKAIDQLVAQNLEFNLSILLKPPYYLI